MRRLLLLVMLTGCRVGVGPTIGICTDGRTTFGWETTGGFVFAAGAVGQTFRSAPSEGAEAEGERTELDAPDARPADAPLASVERVTYVALEPAYLVAGLSLGVASSSQLGLGPYLGGFGDVGWTINPGNTFNNSLVVPYWSVALGYRYAHGHELYLTPKLGVIGPFSGRSFELW